MIIHASKPVNVLFIQCKGRKWMRQLIPDRVIERQMRTKSKRILQNPWRIHTHQKIFSIVGMP